MQERPLPVGQDALRTLSKYHPEILSRQTRADPRDEAVRRRKEAEANFQRWLQRKRWAAKKERKRKEN